MSTPPIDRRTLVAAGLAMPAGGLLAAPPAKSGREVLAFYYPWYGNPAVSGRWFHWRGPRNQALRQSPTLDHPTLGFYDSHDPTIVATHMRQARAAGLTSLVVSWWGRNSFEDRAMTRILNAAHAQGLSITVYLEQQKDGAAGAARDCSYLLATHAGHPAWLHRDGRPVLFLYLQALRDLSAREWRRAAGRAFLVGDVSPRERAQFSAWAPFMDGIHVYVLAPYVKGMSPAAMTDWADRTYPAWKRMIGTKLFCATVIPGFDDTLVPGRPDPRPTVDRHEGRTYQALWDAAIRHRADWVVVTSFNEWHEGSEIEPSREHGDRYLRLTAAAARRYLAS